MLTDGVAATGGADGQYQERFGADGRPVSDELGGLEPKLMKSSRRRSAVDEGKRGQRKQN